ncbi:PIG-L deacetylase family protein [Mesoterricola silvestris]|uniref:PIG-L domain-containing protein n=1 Tax=Mesoterricola silvestris TaxID=2927979 RepID=A0AA48KA71_9BACT|nr:PIG-L deacetylase family protein [Mesoterricola silvestris]BDU71228.1 PIG-L domain-containing protein [Mesoterricola silvestris]
MRPVTKLVLAPHADDEVLGLGGSIARWAREGHPVHVVVATRGYPPVWSPDEEAACRAEALEAHARLGVASARFLDLPAAELDTLMHRELNRHLLDAVRRLAPEELYLPFLGDLHRDHQLVAQSALVAARPSHSGYPRRLYAYETLSETNWNAPSLTPGFIPNHFVDISGTLEEKLGAFAAFRSQVKAPPHERSLEALRALAVLRGATVGLAAAEAFVTIRTVA